MRYPFYLILWTGVVVQGKILNNDTTLEVSESQANVATSTTESNQSSQSLLYPPTITPSPTMLTEGLYNVTVELGYPLEAPVVTTIINVSPGNCSFPLPSGTGKQYASCCNAIQTRNRKILYSAFENLDLDDGSMSFTNVVYSTVAVTCGGKYTYLEPISSEKIDFATRSYSDTPKPHSPQLQTRITCEYNEEDCPGLWDDYRQTFKSWENKYLASKPFNEEDELSYGAFGPPQCGGPADNEASAQYFDEFAYQNATCIIFTGTVDFYYKPVPPVDDLCAPLLASIVSADEDSGM
ncbi:hypothetical protein BT63DRAFT_101638 [Microthyrium microscopicum]|uniref:Uncharacterized protein n=1 Tax=Microthyrium microscopicum TaxID=703497 RepID=A0A6A6TYR1_9PEZI|nr:hypothetical protein BT63DRAFT_101638 [Microthyrium microscopicum]